MDCWDLKYSRTWSSVCMVDNDRFISILGGIKHTVGYRKQTLDTTPLHAAELYALNCKKSIKIKNMIRARKNAHSFYHKEKHQIFISGECKMNGMECYDINKDKWSLVMDEVPFYFTRDMFISGDDPNIVFMMGVNSIDLWELHRIDLRMNIDKDESLLLKQENDLDDSNFVVLQF